MKSTREKKKQGLSDTELKKEKKQQFNNENNDNVENKETVENEGN